MKTALLPHLHGEWGAVYSDCDRYRYRLWREWDRAKPTIAFCMLNPSTATEIKNDPTIERCQRRAVAMGYGRLEIVNIFALRSTDPMALYDDIDPVGPDNLDAIAEVARDASMLICGWGKHGRLYDMGETVRLRMLGVHPGKLYVLAVNRDGSPRHPLYVGYDAQPHPWA